MLTTLLDVQVFASAEELDPNAVTPGVIGFFAIFFIAAATVLLLMDMTRRVRRTRYRGEVRERLDAEDSEADNAGAGVGEMLDTPTIEPAARASDAVADQRKPETPRG